MTRRDVIVVGGGHAGLAVAKCLKDQGVDPLVLDREAQVGGRWAGHYQRLHLHTPKGRSALPGAPWEAAAPRYPERDAVAAYLRSYAERFGIATRQGVTVTRLEPEEGGWRLETSAGEMRAAQVVLATGYSNRPIMPESEGLAQFPGQVLHAEAYDSGAEFAGQRVLVVGYGNSGAEIALDLVEQGARPGMSVRGPVSILPRDVLGLPMLGLTPWLAKLPRAISDQPDSPIFRPWLGNPAALGLEPPAYGPRSSFEKGRVPVFDIGTLKALREGAITLHKGIRWIEGAEVVFADESRARFDVLVFATGYAHGREALVDLPEDVAEALSNPVEERPDYNGLHVIGSYLSPRGMIFEIAQEAPVIAARVCAEQDVLA